jgi:hypothetical protein
MVRSGKRPDPQLGFRIRPQPATAFPSVVIRLGPRLFWEECVVATTTIDGEFAVVCATCGNELDVTVEEKALPRRRSAVVTVEPCETCLGRRYEDGLADQRDMDGGRGWGTRT